jgi:ubiquitin carboxyl-terminal hydrolase 16/45
LSGYTLVDSVFGGHLLSSIVCEECKTCSQRVEPFLDLSLPISDETAISFARSSLARLQNLAENNHVSKSKKNSKEERGSKKSSTKKDKDSYDKDDFKKKENHDEAENDAPIIDLKSQKLSKHQEKKMKKSAKKTKKKGSSKHQDQNDDEEKHQQQEKNEGEYQDERGENLEENQENEVNKDLETATDAIKNLDLYKEAESQDSAENASKSDDEALQPEEDEEECDHNLENMFNLEAQKSLSDARTFEQNTLQFFLAKFTQKETLNDKINCENCTRKLNNLSSSSTNRFFLSRLVNNLKHFNEQNVRKAYSTATKQYLICELPAVLTIHLKRFQQHGFRLEKSNKFVDFPLVLDMSPFTSKMCVNANINNNNNNNRPILYSLFGLVEHSGKLNSGHYTAFVKAMPKTSQNCADDNSDTTYEINRILSQHRLCHLKKMFKTWSDKHQQTNNQIHSHYNKEDYDQSTSSSQDRWFYISDSHVSEITAAKVLKSQAYLLFYHRVQ